MIDPTRRTGELDCMFGPTRRTGELDGLFDPTRQTGELVGAFGPTRPFGKLDNGCFAVRDPLSEGLNNLSRRLIVRILFGIVMKLDLGVPACLFFLNFISLFQRGHFRGRFR